MHAADTNVLVRVIMRDEPEQFLLAEAYVARGVWVSHVVLSETAWVLRAIYRFDRSALADVIEMLLAHDDVTLQDAEIVEAALSLYRAHSNISFADCLILETARNAGHLPLATFDKALAKLPGVERL